MKILGLEHVDVEHPGYFLKLLQEDGHTYHGVNLGAGEQIPSLDNFDGLWVMGGPMDVWEEEKYPWLINEKNFIKKAVIELGIPYLGLCLGHQLLAEALGGKVAKSKKPEIGVLNVNLTEIGSQGIFFDGVDEEFKCLQWHSAEVTRLPSDAEILASSSDCLVQSLKWGTRAYSIQFHLEVEENTVQNWGKIPSYSEALSATMGPEGLERLNVDCKMEMTNFNSNAERVYLNWMQTSART
ncbi:MAG: GMP synthase [Rhodobacteraceae bacterium]|nr:MAG: GMP synthase [Paracoccaceae bacterium]